MLALRYSQETGTYDLADDGDGFLLEETLATVEIYSIHIDKRGVGNNGKEERGYWGNPNEGSLIWRYIGQPLTISVVDLIGQDIKRALQWMISIGIATKIDIEGSRVGPDRCEYDITIVKNDGQHEKFHYIWEATKGIILDG